jgi:hypothetical protein
MLVKTQVKAIKEETSYGHLTLSSQTFPFVKDLKIGDSKECIITVKIKGLREADRWEIQDKQAKPKDIMASVTITKIEMHKPKKDDKKKVGY